MERRVNKGPESRPGDCLRHPIVMAMLCLWLLNDHLLKDLYGNMWTGKLSDVAGLVVFPLIPVALYEFFCVWKNRSPTHTTPILHMSLLATGLLLIGINLSQTCSDLCCQVLATLQWPIRGLVGLVTGEGWPPLVPVSATPDPTDLLTLPALFIPLKLHQTHQKLPPG